MEGESSNKYVRYTREQVEALERLYEQCPKPSSLRRQQLIRECPVLFNVDPKQIKVWFQNRRCRDKQRKESSRLKCINRKLSAMNRLLLEENDRLQKQVRKLVYDNRNLRQNLQNKYCIVGNTNSECIVTIGQHENQVSPTHLQKEGNAAGLLSIANDVLKEFLEKATGTAIEWIQMPGMKPGPESNGIVGISHGCAGVAARACGLINMEPSKATEILKNRQSWLCTCRSLEVLSSFTTSNGGTIELLYIQLYASTTLASARDLWTLRYTTDLDDGSIVVCERSLTGSHGGLNMPPVPEFVRAEMFSSGYLIRPCEGGSSIVHIVDHLNLEPCTVPEVLRPIYESSIILAETMTVPALNSLCIAAQELTAETTSVSKPLMAFRRLSQKIRRGFNDAINSFSDDGWSLMGSEGMGEVVLSVNACPSKLLDNKSSSVEATEFLGFGILCAKASLLLQNVSPSLLINFLREHRSEWADCSIDIYLAATLKTLPLHVSKLQEGVLGGNRYIPSIIHTIQNEEFVDIVKLEEHGLTQEETVLSRDMFILQVCSGVSEKATAACSELLFAPTCSSLAENGPLLPSGFRLIGLDSDKDCFDSDRTLDLASALDIGSTRTQSIGGKPTGSKSVIIIAFQFIYEKMLQDNVATMASQYVHSVVEFVQKVVMALAPGLCPQIGSRSFLGSPEAHTLSYWIYRSYRLHLGFDLFKENAEVGVLKQLWHHADPIMCCSWKPLRFFTFANQAGLDMLETTLVSLQDISLETVMEECRLRSLSASFQKLMEQGYCYMPFGICMSSMGRPVSYDRALAWKVLDDDNDTHCMAFMFMNWSFA